MDRHDRRVELNSSGIFDWLEICYSTSGNSSIRLFYPCLKNLVWVISGQGRYRRQNQQHYDRQDRSDKQDRQDRHNWQERHGRQYDRDRSYQQQQAQTTYWYFNYLHHFTKYGTGNCFVLSVVQGGILNLDKRCEKEHLRIRY